MGANGSFANKVTGTEEGRRYKTITAIGDNIKILEPKQVNGAIKLPEESHSPNRIYVTFYKDGHDVKEIAVYGADAKKIYEIHTIDHKGLGAHYHKWVDGRPSGSPEPITKEMKKLLEDIRNFKK